MTVVTAVAFSATLTAARGAAAVRGDDRRVVVDVGDRDRDGLGVGQGAVGDLHRDVVDVVAAGIGRGLEVGGRDEGQHAGAGVDRELGGIGAADDRIGQGRAGIGVGRGDRGDRGGVLGDVDRRGGAAAVRGDDRGVVVDVGDRDGDGLGVGAACRRRPAR